MKGYVADTVNEETNTGLLEYQNVLQKFNEEVNIKQENSKLGGLRYTVENSEKFTRGLRIQLEGKEAGSCFGSSYSFNNL